jgi:hypothetical protein
LVIPVECVGRNFKAELLIPETVGPVVRKVKFSFGFFGGFIFTQCISLDGEMKF